MSKRTASSESICSIENLLPIRNDPGKLREALAGQNMDSIEEIIARLLNIAADVSERGMKHRKLAPNRPPMPTETFNDIAAFLDRDTLDSMQLACRFMLDVVRDRETDKLALRLISDVYIGQTMTSHEQGCESYWLPGAYVYRHGTTSDRLVVNNTSQLSVFLRFSYCERICFDDLGKLQIMSGSKFESVSGVLFDGLTAQNTTVGALTIDAQCSTHLVQKCLNAFKSTSEVCIDQEYYDIVNGNDFDDNFFVNMTRQGVRSFVIKNSFHPLKIDAETALAFAFAEPTASGARRLEGVELRVESDFLAKIRQKANELDVRQAIDFKFSVSDFSGRISPVGFEKYKKGIGKLHFDDLRHHVTVELKKKKYLINVHVYSSV